MIALIVILCIIAYIVGIFVVAGFTGRVMNHYKWLSYRVNTITDDPLPLMVGFFWPVAAPLLILAWIGKQLFQQPINLGMKIFHFCLNGNPWESWKGYVKRNSS